MNGIVHPGKGDRLWRGIIIGTAHRCHTVMVKHNKWNKWHTKKVTFFVKERICH